LNIERTPQIFHKKISKINQGGNHMSCIFCEKLKIIKETKLSYAIHDKYPVSPGHTLIIPKRHVSNYFDLTDEEKIDLHKLMEEMKIYLDQTLSPDGYNIGINAGKAAGQTIMHVHIHLIPRYQGDIPNPTGGIRGAIPHKRIY
jgi:diadenosine tetraphosphate (Ap4A) HIT family hydrolase